MKFAKELDESAVQEWKTKYLDYKQGKKKLKAVTRAIRNVDKDAASSRLDPRPSPFPTGSSARDAPVLSMLNRGRDLVNGTSSRNNLQVQRTRSAFAGTPWQAQGALEEQSDGLGQPLDINERSPLRQGETQESGRPLGRIARYGSIIGTPPKDESPVMQRLSQQRTTASSLELPDPALDPQCSKDQQQRTAHDQASETPPAVSVQREDAVPNPPQSQLSHTGNAYKIGKAVDGPPQSNDRAPQPRRTHTFPNLGRRPAFLRHVFPSKMGTSAASNSLRDNADVALEAYREVDFRKDEFFMFLDSQLDKIDTFYVEKEKEASDRLNTLREQLHILRDRRNEELAAAEQHKRKSGELFSRSTTEGDPDKLKANGKHDHGARNSVSAHLDNALDKVKAGHLGKTSKAMRDLGTPNFRLDPNNLDFSRRPQDGISYRTAKRKLKNALTEFYRGLELLKAYALLNRTAFRKITKKADKTIPWTAEKGAPGKDYMIERVNVAKFVTGDGIETLMQTTEDYYARYFERGNRKMAISKLRSKHLRHLDYHGAFFRAGLYGAAGTVLCILAVIKGAKINLSPNHHLAEEAGYLLQIYGGYFLLLLAASLFCLGCREFTRYKVNYQFVLELNPRHSLNWRQLSEIPAAFLFLLGIVMYLNFSWVGGETMFFYWPVVLVGLAAIILFAPIPEFYWRSRYWFAEAFWRLLFSGIYPVEFRDLFVGDMMCSQTYAFGNIVLYFCLYARHWQDPPQCNSGHSMLFGFFTTLPAIFRLAQCLRRFGDTYAAFPHLANAGKYTCTILYMMTLSLFRLDKSYERLAVFATFSAINSVYCSVWDVIMDFSKLLLTCHRVYGAPLTLSRLGRPVCPTSLPPQRAAV